MRRSPFLWFQRLSEVRGVNYVANPTIDRTALQGANAVARVRVWDFNGRRTESVEWSDPSAKGADRDSTTSAAPCSSWETKPKRRETPNRTLVRQVREALELPGTPRDYHFVLTSGVLNLWSQRTTEPWILGELESLCLLDLRLVEAYPDSIRNEYLGEDNSSPDADEQDERSITVQQREFFSLPTLDFLLRLYQREGYLQEALGIARRAVSFGGSAETVSDLEERLRAIAAEEESVP